MMSKLFWLLLQLSGRILPIATARGGLVAWVKLEAGAGEWGGITAEEQREGAVGRCGKVGGVAGGWKKISSERRQEIRDARAIGPRTLKVHQGSCALTRPKRPMG